ncbi:MAG: hypothetical protein OJF58_004058 [Enhydrobacter sp.]|nr:MAG: hypothetical protein OJF58_004058 [Enhydrobacter sp.]
MPSGASSTRRSAHPQEAAIGQQTGEPAIAAFQAIVAAELPDQQVRRQICGRIVQDDRFAVGRDIEGWSAEARGSELALPDRAPVARPRRQPAVRGVDRDHAGGGDRRLGNELLLVAEGHAAEHPAVEVQHEESGAVRHGPQQAIVEQQRGGKCGVLRPGRESHGPADAIPRLIEHLELSIGGQHADLAPAGRDEQPWRRRGDGGAGSRRLVLPEPKGIAAFAAVEPPDLQPAVGVQCRNLRAPGNCACGDGQTEIAERALEPPTIAVEQHQPFGGGNGNAAAVCTCCNAPGTGRRGIVLAKAAVRVEEAHAICEEGHKAPPAGQGSEIERLVVGVDGVRAAEPAGDDGQDVHPVRSRINDAQGLAVVGKDVAPDVRSLNVRLHQPHAAWSDHTEVTADAGECQKLLVGRKGRRALDVVRRADLAGGGRLAERDRGAIGPAIGREEAQRSGKAQGEVAAGRRHADAPDGLGKGREQVRLTAVQRPTLEPAVVAARDEVRLVEPCHRGEMTGQGARERDAASGARADKMHFEPPILVRSRQQQHIGVAGAEGEEGNAGGVEDGQAGLRTSGRDARQDGKHARRQSPHATQPITRAEHPPLLLPTASASLGGSEGGDKSASSGNLSIVEPGESRNGIGPDLAQQRREVIMETLAGHQSVAEGYRDQKGLDDRPVRRGEAEETADMAAVPCRFGEVAVIVGPVAALAWAALDLDIEGGPPLPIVGGGACPAVPGLAGGEVVETAFGVKSGQRGLEVMGVLGRELATEQVSKGLVHGAVSSVFEFG